MEFRPLGASVVATLFLAALAGATIFSNLRGIVHDPDHRPIKGASVTVRARNSSWAQTVNTNDEGDFEFSAVPVGNYTVTVTAAGFSPQEQQIELGSGVSPILHFLLSLAVVSEKVQVSSTPEPARTSGSVSATLVSREEVAQTPGADRSNSLAMITDYVPGATLVHDQLHIRGGHQVSWLVDGVPVPNTNIASNVGPQFDPKDVDYVELERGGYSAEYGDRAYGVFNVVPRTGFEYSRQAELVTSYGSFHQTNDQLNLGSHTERFAYYGSLNANRSDLGLMAPTSSVIHDMGSGVGGFGDLIYNTTPNDQLRLVGSARGDHYQIPNTPVDQAAGKRDLDEERDAFLNFSWLHTFNPGTLLTVSPFYHFNRAHYLGGAGDSPFILDDDRASNYFGGQATLAVVRGKHNAQAGLEALGQRDDTVFDLRASGHNQSPLHLQLTPWGGVEALFAQEQYRATSWLWLNGGLRLTHYHGLISENAANPRLGASLRVPKLAWVLHGFYGRYYQPPPLDTVAGPLLQFALQQGAGFLPLRGERDEEYEAGIEAPLRGWRLDADTFRTHARNFFDHDALGDSNIFLPLTIQGARIFGWEATARSPRLLRRVQANVVYSHQHAEGFGAVTGGLTNFAAPQGNFFLDHDQRNTLSGVFSAQLPRRAWATAAVSYGSGFLRGNGPDHLAAHTTLDLSFGKSLGERWSVAVSALNLTNQRYLLDESNTFGGTHYNDPRQVYVELRRQFHF